MTQRRKFIAYLIFVHGVFGVGAYFFLAEQRIWLLTVEAFFVVSFVIGSRLIYSLTPPLEFIEASTDLIKESDFTSRFLDTGQLELDQLIHIYNQMVDNLREERTRHQELNYFLDKVLRASPSGILTCDFDGHVMLANPSAGQMLGFSASELKGKKLSEICPKFVWRP